MPRRGVNIENLIRATAHAFTYKRTVAVPMAHSDKFPQLPKFVELAPKRGRTLSIRQHTITSSEATLIAGGRGAAHGANAERYTMDVNLAACYKGLRILGMQVPKTEDATGDIDKVAMDRETAVRGRYSLVQARIHWAASSVPLRAPDVYQKDALEAHRARGHPVVRDISQHLRSVADGTQCMETMQHHQAAADIASDLFS